MKKPLFCAAFCILALTLANGQFRLGVRAGIISVQDFGNPLTVLDEVGQEVLEVGLKNAKIGYTGGLVLQFQFGSFLLQPEVLYSYNQYEYNVDDDPLNPMQPPGTAQESYQYLDVPLLLGFKLGPLRLQAGPEGHLYLNSTSDLTDLEFYKENIDDFTLGWTGNIGLDIWNLMLDVRYCGNLTSLGTSFQVGEQEFAFDERPSRWVFSLGILFGR